MRLKLIACEIFCREVCQLVAASPNTLDVEFLPKGLHDLESDRMVARLQERVDAVPPGLHEAVLLGYALCNNGVVGLRAGETQLVLPRGHDCLSLFLGDRRRYEAYFRAHPGTYYRTTGWFEREDTTSVGEETVPQRLGLNVQYDDLVARFGEDNARYVMETLGDFTAHYTRLAYLHMGLPCEEPFRCRARQEAARNGWEFDELEGSLELLQRLLDGPWSQDDFLIVPPGHRIAATHDAAIVRAVP